MKFLIEISTKLYGEFWGSLSNNLSVSHNLNLKKLFFIGNKLNQLLLEIDILWETDLKMRKIDFESQSIVQLYAFFLREILKNKKKSEEISKKINEEQIFESKKNGSDKLDLENLDALLENQELVIYSRTNEKGQCNIIQCSNSIVSMFGYSKQEVIGKKIEYLMPSIYQAEHNKNLSKKIRILRSSYGADKDIFKNTEKKQFFILPKNKAGYLLAINSRFKIYNEDDFSNSFIIRSRFECKDTKSIYAYYILTKEDFTIDSISSSCLNINMSMDILKKYMIDISYLIRAEDLSQIFWQERYQDYEEEPKRVTWIFPDLLFPRNGVMDLTQKEDIEIEELIHKSQKKEMNLVVSRTKFKDDQTLGYCFRFSNIEPRKQNQENLDIKFNFINNKILLYDMNRLNYSRTVIVNEKKKKNEPVLFTSNPDKELNKLGDSFKMNSDPKNGNSPNKKNKKKKKNKQNSGSESSSENEEHLDDNLITNEKLNELQSKSKDEIKTYIENLFDFSEGVAFFKREIEYKNSYEDHFHKFSLIRQTLDLYNKRQLARLAVKLDRKHDKNKNQDGNSSSLINYANNFNSETSSYLNDIFNEKSITNIKYFSFFLFLILCLIISMEFFISINILNDCNDRIFYSEKAFKILNSLLYTKFFLTEAILAQQPDYKNIDKIFNGNNSEYIIDLMREMSDYHQIISNNYDYFSNATITFSNQYYSYYANTYVYQRTLSNGIPSSNLIPFSSSISTVNKIKINNILK